MTISSKARLFFSSCFLIVTIWFILLVWLTYEFEPVPEAVIIGPNSALVSAIENSDVKVTGGSAPYMSVIGEKPGFVRELYRNGAWLVLPGSVSGCFDPKRWISVERKRIGSE